MDGSASKDDAGKRVAVDSSGNVYVAGNVWNGGSQNDYITIKYSSTGTLLWKKTYDGKTNRDDYVNAMTVDSAGNVYVTGTSIGTGQDGDYLTLKYDTNGVLKWAKSYNGSGDWDDAAQAIAVDSAGNVYVTGWSWGLNINHNYATIKYSPTGSIIWLKTNNGSADSEDLATSIAVDKSGNVFVTGGSFGASGSFDFLTIKYSPTGTRLWYNRYDGPGSGLDYANAMTLDDAGNIYVTGASMGADKNYDFVTIKYDTNGKTLWGRRYDGAGKGDDIPNAIAVDKSGNVYVTGQSYGSKRNYDFATVKYDSTGVRQWVKLYNGSANGDDIANSLALDSAGNVYVAGASDSTNGKDYYALKYSPDGAVLWSARFNNTGVSQDDVAQSIAVDASGNVYITGTSAGGATGNDILTLKYTP